MLSNIIFLAASAALARAHGTIWGPGMYCANVRSRRREARQKLTVEQEGNPNADYPTPVSVPAPRSPHLVGTKGTAGSIAMSSRLSPSLANDLAATSPRYHSHAVLQ